MTIETYEQIITDLTKVLSTYQTECLELRRLLDNMKRTTAFLPKVLRTTLKTKKRTSRGRPKGSKNKSSLVDGTNASM